MISETGKAKVDGGLVPRLAADLGKLVVSSGEADLESLDFAEPAFAFGFGDAGEEVVADGMAEYDLSRAVWRKSSRSGSSGGECVEVAGLDAANAVRDSKNPDRGVLILDGPTWQTFICLIKRGGHDL